MLSSEIGVAAADGLMNCGDSIDHGWHRWAAQMDKVLKGAKPGDLLIEQATKFQDRQGPRPNDPQSVLGRADQMIE